MRDPGQQYVEQGVLLRRFRSGANDCYLHYFLASGEVLSLFLRNGMASSKRMGDSLGSFGISEIHWQSDRSGVGGRLISVEGFWAAPWHLRKEGYGLMSVLMEIAAAEHKPGSLDRRGADFLFALMQQEQAPTLNMLYRYLQAAGYLHIADEECPLCAIPLLHPQHPALVLVDDVLCCPRATRHRSQLAELLAGILGHPSKFLPLLDF